MQSEILSPVTQILLFFLSASAAIFLFFYKSNFGQLSRNFSISLITERVNINTEKDYLVVKAKIKRNSVGIIEIHDAQIKATWDTGEAIKALTGIERLGIIKRKGGDVLINWNSKPTNGHLRFASDEESEFSTWVEVPKDKLVAVELAIVAPSFRTVDQWKASAISLPLKQS